MQAGQAGAETQHALYDPTTTLADGSPRPADDDRESWRAHWVKVGQPWRREPEIVLGQQRNLAQTIARSRAPGGDPTPFRGTTLTRADVEWLLAHHDDGCGPVDWSDPAQRARVGLDLRGAYLKDLDLSGLPLARTRGGPTIAEWQELGGRDPYLPSPQADTWRIHLG